MLIYSKYAVLSCVDYDFDPFTLLYEYFARLTIHLLRSGSSVQPQNEENHLMSMLF